MKQACILLNFVAMPALCMLSTVLNGALPPAPDREVQRRATNFEIGLIALKKGLSNDTMNSIQNFVAPEERSVTLKLAFGDNFVCATPYTIYFIDKNRKAIAGSTLSYWRGGLIEKTICIPVDEPLTVKIAWEMVSDNGFPIFRIRKSLILEPRQLRSIKAISIGLDFATITYTDSSAEDKIRLY